MKKAILFMTLFFLSMGTVYFSNNTTLKAAPAAPQATAQTGRVTPELDIITSRTMEDGRIATSHLGIFGPQICTAYGDPYSPLNSTFAPGPHTYQYRIRIPATYPSDVVRVELFDPDSINQALNEATILRTNMALNNGLNPSDVKTCGIDGGNADQKEPCLLETDELTLVNNAPNLDLDQVNPYWLVRIDENRGAGNPPGDGTCGSPITYTSAYNTATMFTLAYYPTVAGQPERIPLVSYVGQTGDNTRDSGDHNTDMRWVSPGTAVPFSSLDSPGNIVPAIPYTINSFEVDLTTDVPGISTDPRTGDRYLYLEVTALSGASENGYEIWAGPPTYVDTIPSEVNARNLFILNNPGSHDSQGVEITAVQTLVQNTNYPDPIGIPLAYIGPEMAGQTLDISLFDTDSGAQPPIVFYFDTIAFTPDAGNPLGYDPTLTDWAMAFGVTGLDDPDGVAQGVRCLPGNCHGVWVEPAYQITIPGDLSNCDWQNPTPEACTPFYGGRLMALYDGGYADTFAWELTRDTESAPLDQTLGCAAFPISISHAARSVTAPGTGSNPYPDAAEFTYPTTPPSYENFINHTDLIPLSVAQPGDVYRVYNGFGDGNFGWLVWNTGVSANASTLANSLTWPGDSTDYTACSGPGCPPGGGIPGSGFDYNVPGYIEPFDLTDQALHINDWVAGSTGVVDTVSVRDQLNGHIDLERTLRLPIWNNVINTGASINFQNAQFGIFRLIGYNLSNSWLLLEFEGFDTSCGQLPVAPTTVEVPGPIAGEADNTYTFTATISPTTTTLPITYTWEITNFDPIVSVGGLSDSITVSWDSGGSKEVTVTAVNNTGLSVSQSHTIDIANRQLYLPFINKN